MKILLFGASGMLGQALTTEINSRSYVVIGAARRNCAIHCDITNDEAVEQLINRVAPDVIINAAASVNLRDCSLQPELAYAVNARSVSIMANAAKRTNSYFVQISTDHYYTGDGSAKHNENDRITLLNEYARTKYAGELFARTYSEALVVRTNIVGFRNQSDSFTFVEWVLNALNSRQKITMFDDFYTSSIDVTHFSKSLLDIIERKVTGVINLASSEVSSKKQFIVELAASLNLNLSIAEAGSVMQINDGIPRAESLGLDTSIVENILGYKMPLLSDVISSISDQVKKGSYR